MIDIHSHIIYGVDDGPKTLEDSLKLVKSAYDQGVKVIVATSHRRKNMFDISESMIVDHFRELKKAVATHIASDMTLLFGGEIYYTEDVVTKLVTNKLPKLVGTNYALIEFSMDTPYRTMHDALSQLLRHGIRPVVAHIERYNELDERTDRIQTLINMGCYMQVNSVNVLKPKMIGDHQKIMKKRTAFYLQEDLVHFVASDMHSVKQRPSYMQQAYAIVEEEYGTQRAHHLFVVNQLKLLKNREL